MELRSTGNPDINNLVTMSMLEYLKKKGIEDMGMTNAERIRNMANEELAKFLSECADCATCQLVNPKNCRTEETCTKAFVEWLKQPVED